MQHQHAYSHHETLSFHKELYDEEIPKKIGIFMMRYIFGIMMKKFKHSKNLQILHYVARFRHHHSIAIACRLMIQNWQPNFMQNKNNHRLVYGTRKIIR